MCYIIIHNNTGQCGKDEPCRLIHNDAVVRVVFFEPLVEPYNVYENRRDTQRDCTEEYICSHCQVSVANGRHCECHILPHTNILSAQCTTYEWEPDSLYPTGQS
mgnify:CR=1 FL=1